MLHKYIKSSCTKQDQTNEGAPAHAHELLLVIKFPTSTKIIEFKYAFKD